MDNPAEEKPRVLILDDEQPNLDTFKRVFRNDFEISVASSVARGLELASKYDFHVAIVDYAMPEQNGVVFLREVAPIRPGMARLMVTAHADLDEVKQAYDEGLAQAIIIKPWDRDTILRWVTNALRMQSLKRSVRAMRDTVEKK